MNLTLIGFLRDLFLGVSTFGVCSSLAVHRVEGLLFIYPVSQQVSETWIPLGSSYAAFRVSVLEGFLSWY